MVGLLLLGCPAPEPVEPTLPECDVTWDNFARGYVDTWCTPCHSATLQGDDRQGAPPGTDFDQWSDVAAMAERVRVRATGPQPDMPPLGGTDPQDVLRLEAWLDCGAPGSDDPPGPCDQLVTGPATTVRSQAEADALCATFNAVEALDVSGTVALDCLCAVGGDLDAGGAVELPLLASVGGSVTATASATTLAAPALVEVGGALTLSAPTLAEVDLRSLDRVGTALSVVGADRLVALELGGLQQVGSLEVRQSAMLSRLSVPRLREVDGSFVLEALPALDDLDETRAVQSIGLDLVLRDLDALGELDSWAFQFLDTLGGDLVVSDNASLSGMGGLTLLRWVPGDVIFEGNASLRSVDGLDTLSDIGGDLVLRGNPLQENVFGLDNLDAVGGTLTVEALPQLRSLAGIAALRQVGGLRVVALPVPGFPWLGTLEQIDGDLLLQDNSGLETFTGLAGVATVGGDLTVRDNPALPTVDVQTWVLDIDVGGVVTVEGNG